MKNFSFEELEKVQGGVSKEEYCSTIYIRIYSLFIILIYEKNNIKHCLFYNGHYIGFVPSPYK